MRGETDVWMCLKICSMARGMMPLSSAELKPSMVYVLPVPVWPYAKMVAL
jgi:hypothetical protein